MEWDFLDLKRKVLVLANRGWRTERLVRGKPLPILIVLHDEVRSANPQYLAARFAPMVFSNEPSGSNDDRDHHFVVIVPEGIQAGLQVAVTTEDGAPNLLPVGAWNSGHRGADAIALSTDDVAAIERILHKVLIEFQSAWAGNPVDRLPRDPDERALDPTLVFVVGHGNGGEMAFRLAVELADQAVARGRGYRVVVRGVGVYGGSHEGKEFDGAPLSSWRPTRADTVVVVAHGSLDDDFIETPLASPILQESEAFDVLLDNEGLTEATPPRSADPRSARLDWTPVGASSARAWPTSSTSGRTGSCRTETSRRASW